MVYMGYFLGICFLLLSGCGEEEQKIAYPTRNWNGFIYIAPTIMETDLNGTYPDPEEENLAFTVPVAGKEDFQ